MFFVVFVCLFVCLFVFVWDTSSLGGTLIIYLKVGCILFKKGPTEQIDMEKNTTVC